jgi:hypothetical protein
MPEAEKYIRVLALSNTRSPHCITLGAIVLSDPTVTNNYQGAAIDRLA